MPFRNFFGWKRDTPDDRDYTLEHPNVKKLLGALKTALPASFSVQSDCSPVYDQGDLGSCTANAGVSLYEAFENHAFGSYSPASRLFLYKATRNLMMLTGDSGAEIRSTMGTMAMIGIAPERYWTYQINDFDVEPPTFVYATANGYKVKQYVKLDPPQNTPDDSLYQIKAALNSHIPSMFGFNCYPEIRNVGSDGNIPYPDKKIDSTIGGHAVMICGYDDNRIIPTADGSKTAGAFQIKNSWGLDWGDHGYGWLPYNYLLNNEAGDVWTIVDEDYIETGRFV